jgi:phosphate/sulfate permease
MIAVGWADRMPMQKELVKTIIGSWIFTVPVTAIPGAGIWIVIDWLYYILM